MSSDGFVRAAAPASARAADDAGLVWFRRDLRVDDHAALYRALRGCRRVWCAFVFDTAILDALPSREDRRVEFIRDSLAALHDALGALAPGAGLVVVHGRATDAIPRLAERLRVGIVHAAIDHEPEAVARDVEVARRLAAAGRRLELWKDQTIFGPDEVRTGAGGGYTVYTPYRNAWMKRLEPFFVRPYPVERHAGALAPLPEDLATAASLPGPAADGTAFDGMRGGPWAGVPTLEAIGFARTNLAALGVVPGEAGARALFDDFLRRIGDYGRSRDFPGLRGPSYLSVHLRFGTIPIRRLAGEAWRISQDGGPAAEGASAWLGELIWRDFYFQVLAHWPHAATASFRPEYDAIRFEEGDEADALFAAWTEGRTGYPLVDAAIAQIRHSGWMHNRLRMVAASFLVKDLGIDWRRGERWFADQLIDFDLSANNGGWQWASSSGCDAQPYFRIFNPVTQSQKFDPDGRFIRRYLPQLARLSDKAIHAPWLASASELAAAGVRLGVDYPRPLVDHAQARARTLERYAVVKSRATPAG